MDRDLITVRWVTFVAFLSVAALYLFPRVENRPASYISAGLLILLAAAFVTWSIETSLRYLVRRLSPAAPPRTGDREREIVALRRLRSTTAQQELPAILRDLLVILSPAVDALFGCFWFPEGLPGGPSAPLLLSQSGEGVTAQMSSLTPSFLSGVWQSVSASADPLALHSLSFNRGNRQIALLGMPLAWRDEPAVGLLLLGSDHPLDLDEHQLLLAQTLAGEAALIVQNARLMARVEYQAVVEERARLAREIHDGLAQSLAFLKIQAAQMHYYLHQGKLDRLDEMLGGSRQALGDAYNDARRAIDNLRLVPETDTREWLVRLAGEFQASSGIPVATSLPELEHDLPPTIQVQIVRIVQEALANVRKHARASRAELTCREREGCLMIEISDDGQGLESGEGAAETHYGLIGMQERAEMIGAELIIEGQANVGTTVRLELPLRAPESG
jgi:signal transduction histidine kinase